MNLREHRIPEDVFDALAAGGGDASAVRHLTAAQYSKHVLLIWGVMDTARAFGHEQADQARQAYELLATIQERAPDAVDAVLRHPSAGAWARRALRALHGDERPTGVAPGQLAALAAAAAIRSHTPWSIEVPATDGVIMLPSLGQVTFPDRLEERGRACVRSAVDGATVITKNGHVEIPPNPHQDGPGWRGLRRLGAEADGKELHLLIDDLDPCRMPTATVGARLPAREVRSWEAALRGAWALLVGHHPIVAEEVAAAITVLTPLVPSRSGHVSASSRETFGCVALSTPPDGPTLAVTFAHEVQHAKLAALLDVVALTRPDDGRRYYAPWRDDPRPISGLLHGAYAYLGVTGFWRRQRDHESGDAEVRAHAEFARWRVAAAMASRTLAGSGRLTDAGERFVAGMAKTLRTWEDERVPAISAALARSSGEQHRARWRRHNGEIREPCA